MVQKIFAVGIQGTGIVGTLIIAGIILRITNLSPGIGDLAIISGVGIGIILGLLGVFAVAKRVIG